jgi:AraC family transcriptional regulator of adaptative response/methylated-DNA-[protein]-cysteine methyltransferase
MDTRDYERVARAIQFIEERFPEEPRLEAIAAHVELSPFHFERLFKRWAGTTPKRFIQCLRVAHAKSLLDRSKSILDASFETGLSSPSRLHDLFCTLEAVTPGEYKSGGDGLVIYYGVHATPFGDALLATTERGICGLAFVDGNGDDEVAVLEAGWPQAEIVPEEQRTRGLVDVVFDRQSSDRQRTLALQARGTNFQVQVWRALLAIPPGHVVSYGDVAHSLGRPKAVRAVASAIAANPIACLIPCHRVLRATGALSGYRWGPTRKRALLAWESATHGEGALDEVRGPRGRGMTSPAATR